MRTPICLSYECLTCEPCGPVDKFCTKDDSFCTNDDFLFSSQI